MNYLKENPKGIDLKIQKFQKLIYSKLNWGDINCYGRVYKNISNTDKVVAEVYVGNNEYKDVFTDDTKNANIFFVEDDNHKTTNGFVFTTKLKIVVICNLKKLYPSVTERADLEPELELVRIFQYLPSFNFLSLEKGVKQCLSEFYTENIKVSDMQPLHIFAITGEINYTISCNH
jgi:hypothetical protein